MDKFRKLGLCNRTIENLQKKGFEEPTEIQALTIPMLLNSTVDIIAQAQTGTGKTAAFALPILEKIDVKSKTPQAIIIAPTRELVIQICEEISSLNGKEHLSIAPIYGGQSIHLQLEKLAKGVSIVVGTPGRIMDHLERKTLNLQNIRFFILDEADEMLNMGFIDDIELIFKATPTKKRVLLFSATMPQRICTLAQKYMHSYEHIKTSALNTPELTDQIYFEVLQRDKIEALCRIIDIEHDFYGLIFCRTIVEVDTLTSHLIDRGYAAEALHGDITQYHREKILSKFKKKLCTILIATDVAARGIDVLNLSHVINFSIPHNPEAYIHRIGRTGRAGKQGTAITFVTPSEFHKLGFIKRIAKTTINRKSIPHIKQILQAKELKIINDIQALVSDNHLQDYKAVATKLLETLNPEDIIAAALKMNYKNVLIEKSYAQIASDSISVKKKKSGEKTSLTRLFVAKGKKQNFSKKDLIQNITQKIAIAHKEIENIEMFDDFSFISVPHKEAEQILQAFRPTQSGKKPLITKAKVVKSKSVK